jgi:2-polyprenyl-3-methyl-5-hydroxy-6-metoxy-1,4-benzoquinol methylase
MFRVHSSTCRELQPYVVLCENCHVGESIYDSDSAVEANAYPSDYYSYSPGRYSGIKQTLKRVLFTTTPRTVLSVAHRWLTMIPMGPPGKVLDVGCGCGVFLNLLKRLGWQTYGTDISPAALAICQTNGHQVCPAAEVLQRLDRNSFDWIILDNVLEHIAEPWVVLKQLNQLLRTGGRLTVCVPNFGGKDAPLFGGFWEMLDPPRHYFHYSAAGLTTLLQRCGFEITKTTFQVRFNSSDSLRNARTCGDTAAYRELKTSLALLQLRKAIRLALPFEIPEKYGYFLTVEATKP